MDNHQLADISRDQLNRVLGFFSRVDTVSSIVLGIDIGMLAILATNAPPTRAFSWYTLTAAVVPVLLLAKSLLHIYQGSFPRLAGGWISLIYFREIAVRKEDEFIREFTTQSEDAHIKDLLSQVWRNSEILTEKFNHLKSAFVWLGWALIPWLICLYLFASEHTETLFAK